MLSVLTSIQAQDSGEDPYVYQTFKSFKMVNVTSSETIPKKTLDIRIGHKFGDIAGDLGGWQTFGGLENAADISIGAEYGITDNIGVGISRMKGSGINGGLQQNMVGTFKYRFLRQKKGKGMPLTMTFYGISTMSTQKKAADSGTIQEFNSFSHRMAYSAQVIIARKFGERFSLQLSPGYVHRNIVASDESNGLVFVSAAARLQISKVFGIIADSTVPFSSLHNRSNGYYPSLGIGLEMETGGHIFQINFTNSQGIAETDYIPYTRSTWGEGQFRIAFTISRTFNL